MAFVGPSLILLFNHRLTAPQEADARASLGVQRIVEPPPEIQTIWSQVPSDPDNLADWLTPVADWLAGVAKPGDFVLIQGEFGATFRMVSEAFRLELTPIYSTTDRKAVEQHLEDGSVQITHTFSHVRFRRYEG
ncbi:MAG: hypothetical protein A2512_04965 [Deltaproteobacteria bacterium RIFOXYD12_FULL_56_24]|nr:MAG: hypothetical protein A2512_04965 [Deltaproteobacteria bacterium RIFOXYD12_FULL_56_24]